MDQNLAEPKPISETAPILAVGADNEVFANLAGTLSEIRKLKGVLGYILRSETAAIIDLAERETTSEYAMLSSQTNSCGTEIAKQFNLADIESTLLEGRSSKLLCISIGDNKISVFMDKSCSHAWIAKRILL